MTKRRPNEPTMPDALAYFMTWPTYGTWLPGDERGWVQYKKGRRSASPVLEMLSKARMTEDACILDGEQRLLVEETIEKHCEIRHWILRAVSCRSNHLHVVVSSERDPNDIRKQFKAWCTRRLKELDTKRGVPKVRQNWWAERGSCRHIGDDDSLEAAIFYVDDAQDKKHLEH